MSCPARKGVCRTGPAASPLASAGTARGTSLDPCALLVTGQPHSARFGCGRLLSGAGLSRGPLRSRRCATWRPLYPCGGRRCLTPLFVFSPIGVALPAAVGEVARFSTVGNKLGGVPDTHFSLAVRRNIQSCADRFANQADCFYLKGLSCDSMAPWPRHPEVSSLLQPKSASTDGNWTGGASCTSSRESGCPTVPSRWLVSTNWFTPRNDGHGGPGLMKTWVCTG